MAVQTTKKKRNIPVFYDGGLFHPIRSPQYVKTAKGKRAATKADKAKYDRDRAGDNDDVFDKEIRKSRNLKKADENWKSQKENAIRREMFGSGSDEGQPLVQFVRASGGIKRTFNKRTGKSYDKGELDGLTFKQSKKKGLVSDDKGKSLDKMFQAAREAGFDVSDENDLIDRMDDEIRSGEATFQSHGFLDYKDNPGSRFDVRYSVVKEPDTMRQKGLFSVKRSSSDNKKTGYIVRGVSKKTADEAAQYFNEEMLKLKKQFSKIKKNPSRRGKSAVASAAKTKKRTTAKKTANLRKNGLLDTLATSAMGLSAALNVHDRLKTKKPTKPAKMTLHHNKAKAANQQSLFETRAAQDDLYEKALVAIENGDLSKQADAKRHGKLAGHTDNEVARAIQYARLTYKLKSNPTPATIRETENCLLKTNGLFGRALARHKAGRLYKKQLRLESALSRAKSKRSKQEAKAKKNPQNIYKILAWNSRAADYLYLTTIHADHLDDAIKAAAKKSGRAERDLTGVKVSMDLSKKSKALMRENSTRKPRKNPAVAVEQAINVAIKKGLRKIPFAAKYLADVHVWISKNYGSINKTGNKFFLILPKKNPFDAYESFQGRPSTKTLELETPKGAPKKLYCLGKLLELRLKGHEDIDFRRENSGKTFYICADNQNKQLWLAGGRVATPDAAIKEGYSEPLARITHIVYETQKVHHNDTKPTGYIHKFGEEGGQQPTLAIDGAGFPIIVGGDYTITSLGIAD